jgi:hypothetical protein
MISSCFTKAFSGRATRHTRPLGPAAPQEAEKALKQYLQEHPELQEVAAESSLEKRKRLGADGRRFFHRRRDGKVGTE